MYVLKEIASSDQFLSKLFYKLMIYKVFDTVNQKFSICLPKCQKCPVGLIIFLPKKNLSLLTKTFKTGLNLHRKVYQQQIKQTENFAKWRHSFLQKIIFLISSVLFRTEFPLEDHAARKQALKR